MKQNRVDVISLGCSKNLVDSERLMAMFAAAGLTVVHNAEAPCGQYVVVNTCGFIGDAQEESINMILQIAQLKKHRKIGMLIVMGCLSERFIDELKPLIPEVDRWYGKFNWSALINDLALTPNATRQRRHLTTPTHYAYLKIAEGCDRTCSYCIIPSITGKYVSRSIEDIVDEASELARAGVRELLLIAQDLTFYGRDLYGKPALAALLERLCTIDGIQWIRLHYAYPTQFPYDILPIMRKNRKICAYLDVALQHCSDNMLKLMRRNITREETEQFLARLRQEVPGIHIRTTLLVGHPQETDDDFAQLMDFVREQRFERLGVFAYSHEKGSYADKHYSDDVPQEVKTERVEKIMSLQETIIDEINSAKIGTLADAIVDELAGDYYICRSEYDSPEVDGEVLIDKNEDLKIGNIYTVKITDFDGYDLFATSQYEQ